MVGGHSIEIHAGGGAVCLLFDLNAAWALVSNSPSVLFCLFLSGCWFVFMQTLADTQNKLPSQKKKLSLFPLPKFWLSGYFIFCKFYRGVISTLLISIYYNLWPIFISDSALRCEILDALLR